VLIGNLEKAAVSDSGSGAEESQNRELEKIQGALFSRAAARPLADVQQAGTV
jgi:hypothetical protein